MSETTINSLYTDYTWLNRVYDDREYGPTLPRIKNIAKRVGVRVTGKKKDVLLLEALHAVVSEIKSKTMTRRSPWTKAWPQLVVTTDRAYVRQRMNASTLDLCSRREWVANQWSASSRPYGGLENSGVNKWYVRNVMYATNRNTTPTRTQRRVYFILSTPSDNTVVGFAECRFPPGAASSHLTLVCSKPGLGKLLITAVERISKGFGYSHVSVDPTNEQVWSRYGYRRKEGGGSLMTKNLSGVPPMKNFTL